MDNDFDFEREDFTPAEEADNVVSAPPAENEVKVEVNTDSDSSITDAQASSPEPPADTGYRAPEPRAVYNGYPDQRAAYSNMYAQPTVQAPSEQKKQKRGMGAGGIALLLIACLVISCAGGFGGAYLYGELNPGYFGGGNVTVNKVESNGTTVEIPEGSVAAVAESVADTVVEITTEAVVNGTFFGNYISEGAGSGVIISEDGYIITNNHVISGADTIKVRLKDESEYTATLVATDAQADIAVIKIEAESLHAATLGSSESLIVGQQAVAIGNPLGQLGGTVTCGIISALDREVEIDGNKMRLLQTDAAINPGNSGGGLFNMDGELIGIVNAKSSGDDIEGLGFAIPIDTAYEVAQELITNGYVSGRPALGVSVVEISDMSDYYQYKNSEIGKYIDSLGVYIVSDTQENFEVGDRFIAINGISVTGFDDISEILADYEIGDEVTVTVSRSRKMVEVKVTLVEKQQ